ncbi:GHMP kinase [Buttiauxella sp. B2]|uniref:GHMP family kinase ATP-binding protein n=1 Tax=Buttiauxella sp. B2 TaxID=2587812 RepID=UPI00111D0BF2|nr:GHMP kinase [Buttiauxella sp. B2]TNV19027.1 GHMP kinase [Buttiauxella sp. B2]
MAEARCPASCGEFIQGWIDGGEKLVSCPIDWFSTVNVCESAMSYDERPRMRQMLERVVAHFGHPASFANSLSISLESTIPVGKGLASSTADIAATAVATARHLGQELDEPTLATLCVQIEPTDSTVFRKLTLFDHLNAQVQIACPMVPALELLLLEGNTTLLTEDYHRRNREPTLISSAEVLDNAWLRLQRSCEQQDVRLLAEAATLSSVASQQLLEKPMFNELLCLVEKFDLYGLNVAHSGSVVGLMLDSSKHDYQKVVWQIKKLAIDVHYPKQHLVTMIEGGVR